MQRLEIEYLPSLLGRSPMLTDVAEYWELNVKSCDDVRYLEANGFGPGGESTNQHVVPFALVRSASAREIEEPLIGSKPKETE